MTETTWGDLQPPLSAGDDLTVQVWWQASFGCPALHYEETMPPVVGCNYDWDGAFADEDDG